jgi:hypothetical protein
MALDGCWVRRIALRQQSDHTDAAHSGRRVPPLELNDRRDGEMTIVGDRRGVTGGVDTHLDMHVAAALSSIEPFWRWC